MVKVFGPFVGRSGTALYFDERVRIIAYKV
jgi:hypothetical protein